MNLYITITMLLAGMAMMSGCSSTQWSRNDFGSVKDHLDTISIVFPQIEYSVRYGKEERTKTGYSIFVSKIVAEALKEIADEGETFLKSAVVLDDTLVIRQWMRNHASQSMEQFLHTWDSTRQGSGDKKIFPLTPGLRLITAKVGTRYFLFATGTAYGTSEDLKQFDMLQAESYKLLYDRPFAYEYQWFGVKLHLFIVDAASGEVVWYNSNKGNDSKYNPLEKEEMKNLSCRILKTE